MKWHQLDGIRASCEIESWNIKHIIKIFSFRFIQCVAKWSPICFLHFKHISKGRYRSAHSILLSPPPHPNPSTTTTTTTTGEVCEPRLIQASTERGGREEEKSLSLLQPLLSDSTPRFE